MTRIVDLFRTNPGVDVISGHSIIIDEHDNAIRRSFSDKGSLRQYAYGAAVLMQPSTFFRAEIFRKTSGFNVDNRTNWDGELFIDMQMQGARFLIVNEFFSGYRLQSQSITSSKKLDDGIRKYQQTIFRKIMGRDMNAWDRVPALAYKLMKYTANPKALVERLLKGPVYGRGAVESGGEGGSPR